MTGLRGLPYLVVLERKDAPGEDLSAYEVDQPALEIVLPMPEAREREEASLSEYSSTATEASESQQEDLSAPTLVIPKSPLALGMTHHGSQKRKAIEEPARSTGTLPESAGRTKPAL